MNTQNQLIIQASYVGDVQHRMVFVSSFVQSICADDPGDLHCGNDSRDLDCGNDPGHQAKLSEFSLYRTCQNATQLREKLHAVAE